MNDVALRIGAFSRLFSPRALGVIGLLSALLVAAFGGSLAFGSTSLPLYDIVLALVGAENGTVALIVTQFRLPRALQAVEVGICLAAAGFLLQKITRNPFASPAILGVVDGAGLGVVLFLTLFSDNDAALIVSIAWQPFAAVTGGTIVLILVFLLAAGRADSPMRLLLFGVALAVTAKATAMLFIMAGPIHRASQALQWLAGSVHTANWDEVVLIAVIAGPLLLLTIRGVRRLTLLDLDFQTAQSVGLSLRRDRIVPILLAAALTSIAVAVVGGMAFVGLLAPHLARRLVGTGMGAGFIASALVGALMVVGADLGVRVLFSPIEVPTGAVTALVGGPYFIYLLYKNKTYA
jgi:iron complex transport system permease protein